MSDSTAYRWRTQLTEELRDALREHPEFMQVLLAARGITTADEATVFLNPDYDAQLHDPFHLCDMEKAVTRTIHAIDTNERIAVYSDFDADGIPGGALVHDALAKVGHANHCNYIPHRDTDGYGFHAHAVEQLAKDGVALIITVDVGITDTKAVERARELGIDVVITDHHTPGETLPETIAVINPQRADDAYPCPHLCGSGVAFKFIQALFTRARRDKKKWMDDVPEGWEKWLLDLVAIATVGDMVPLVDENRVLAHYGLVVLRKSSRSGVRALCRKLRIDQRHITEDDIGFSIAPRINAASRMDSPEKAFALLTTTDESEAVTLANELESLNNKRKGNVASIVRQLKNRFVDDNASVLVAGSPQWNPALLGLVANSLVDTYHKTVCLWGREGTGALKGSCRGAGEVSVVAMLKESGDALTHYGGHEHAGGFSVNQDDIHHIAEILNDAHSKAKNNTIHDRTHVVDAPLPCTSLRDAHTTLRAFAPFGMENPKPLFVFERARITAVKSFGNDGAHLELLLTRDEITDTIRAIAFFKHPKSFTTPAVRDREVSVVCTLELSRFAGRERYELRIVDIV